MTDRLISGSIAPAFTLTDAHGKSVSLADFKEQRVIVYFYPAAMTPGCTTQAVDFSAALDDFHTAGYEVLGISPDSPEKLARFAEKSDIAFTLLADPEKETLQAYAAYGSKMMYGKEITGVIRSTFIIDVNAAGIGTVAVAQYNVRATGHVAKLRRELGLAE